MNKLWMAALCGTLLTASGAQADADSALAGLDYDKDGQITLDGAIAVRMEAFFAADTNQDGALDEGEYGEMMDAVRARHGIAPSEPQRGQVDPFTFADSDADGLVAAAEYRRATERLVQSLDKDGDGIIVLEPAAGD